MILVLEMADVPTTPVSATPSDAPENGLVEEVNVTLLLPRTDARVDV